jgi:septum formation protein
MSDPVKRIYLASRSPRRRELLKQLGISFEVLLFREAARRGADIDETPRPNERPVDYVQRLAQAKAQAGATYMAQRRLPVYPVLGADTTVVIDGRILGKPCAEDEAIEMLALLSGRTHEVLTAVAICRQDTLVTRLSLSEVSFAALTDAQIRAYAATGESLDKAGAYAIQGRAGAFVRRLSGSYTGIMGLPLYETAELLRALELSVP